MGHPKMRAGRPGEALGVYKRSAEAGPSYVPARVGDGRIKLRRHPAAGERIPVPAQPCERHRPSKVRCGAAGIEQRGPVAACKRLPVPAQAGERQPQARVRLRAFRAL